MSDALASWTPSIGSEVGNLAEETRLPRELLERFYEMWRERQRPFFSQVEDDSTMAVTACAELVRTFKVSSAMLCTSIARVFSEGGERVSFSQFVRGYAKMHARTLREAMPFAFAVFDLNGDGTVSQEEFSKVLNANMEMQEMDPAALNRVLKTKEGQDAATGVTEDAFRYFASLTAETILATCGFCMHVRDFYVPLTPLGTEEEERKADAEKLEASRRARERAHAPKPKPKEGGEGEGGGGEGGEGEAAEELSPFEDPEFLAALEALKTTPEERAERCKKRGNDAMADKTGGVPAKEAAVRAYTEGLDEKPTDGALNATLLSNRAAAHVTLKNWGKALADATAALDADALPEASRLRCCRRAASSALHLSKLHVVEELVGRAEAMAIDAAKAAKVAAAAAAAQASTTGAVEISDAGRAGGAGGLSKSDEAEIAELRKIGASAAKGREEERRRRLAAEAEAERLEDVARAIRLRGLEVGDFMDERVREQCVGAASGARVWYDLEVSDECDAEAACLSILLVFVLVLVFFMPAATA